MRASDAHSVNELSGKSTRSMETVEYIKVAEAARRLDLTAESVRKYLRTGTIPGIRIGAHLRIDWTALLAQIARTGRIEPSRRRQRKPRMEH